MAEPFPYYWTWMSSTQYDNSERGLPATALNMSSMRGTIMLVGQACPDDVCYLSVACLNEDGPNCAGINVRFVEAYFSAAPCAQDTPVLCDSLPSESYCDKISNGLCSTCCMNSMYDASKNNCVIVNIAERVELPWLQTCSALSPAPGYTSWPTPSPLTQPSTSASPRSVPHLASPAASVSTNPAILCCQPPGRPIQPWHQRGQAIPHNRAARPGRSAAPPFSLQAHPFDQTTDLRGSALVHFSLALEPGCWRLCLALPWYCELGVAPTKRKQIAPCRCCLTVTCTKSRSRAQGGFADGA